jgi:hypothetical protein
MSWRKTIVTIPEQPVNTPVKPVAGSWRDTIVSDDSSITPSQTESAVRGAAQGATFGFADELAGSLGVLKNIKGIASGSDSLKSVYEKERDESRAAYKAAQEANPKTYLAGEIGGGVASSFVPGLNIAKGASLAKIATTAAVGGALQSAGSTEATDITEQAKDVASGALVGGVIGGSLGAVSRHFTQGKDLEARLVKDLRPAPTRLKKLSDKGLTETANLLESKGIKNLGVEKNRAQLSKAVKETGAVIGKIYDEVDAVPNSGVKIDAIKQSLNELKSKYAKNAGTIGNVGGIDNLLSNIDVSYANKSAITNKEMRELVSAVQREAYFGQTMQDSAAKKLGKEVSSTLRNTLNSNIEGVLGKNKAQELAGLNDVFSKLSTVDELAKQRAIRVQAGVNPRVPFSIEGAKQAAEDTPVTRSIQDFFSKNMLSRGAGDVLNRSVDSGSRRLTKKD